MIQILNNTWNRLKNRLSLGSNESASKYVITSVLDGYEHTGEIYVQVQVRGAHVAFVKPVKLLYQAEWLRGFSQEDAAYLGVLAASEKNKDYEIVQKIPRRQGRVTANVFILAALFMSTLIVSNIACFKMTGFPAWGTFFEMFDTGLIFVPLTFMACDILTEVYGFRVSRAVIWSGMLALFIVAASIHLSIIAPAHASFEHQDAYATVLGSNGRFFIAAIFAFFSGEYLNALTLSRMKIWMQGRYMALRLIVSSAIGTTIDGILFYFIAFLGTLSVADIWSLIVFQFIFRVGMEVLLLPGVSWISRLLKATDKVDAYDYYASANPFKWKL